MLGHTKGWLRDLPAIFLFGLLTVGMTWPLVLHLDDHVPSDLADPLYTVWLLGRNIRSAENGFRDFGQGNIFYPNRSSVYYGDVLPVQTALNWLIGRLTPNPILAYNILFLLSFVLCAAGMYSLVLHLAGSRPAAVLSSLVFAFCVYRFAHLAHLELLYFAWIPLCFLFLHKFFESLAFRHLLAAAFFYLLQVASCAYYGAHVTFFIVLFGAVFLIHRRLYRKPRFWLWAGLVSAACAAVLLWYFWPYVRIQQIMHLSRPLWEIEFFSAQLQHFLAVPERNVLWGWLLGKLGGSETQLYPGLVPVFLTLLWWFGRPRNPQAQGLPAERKRKRVYLWWDVFNAALFALILAIGLSGGFQFVVAGIKVSARHGEKPLLMLLASLVLRIVLDKGLRRKGRAAFLSITPQERLYLFFLFLSWALCLGPAVKLFGRELFPGLYLLLYAWAPGFETMRVPSRFAVMMMLSLAVLSGWAVARLESQWRNRTRTLRTAAFMFMGFLILAESLMVPLPLAPVKVGRDIPAIYAAVRDLPAGAALVDFPMPPSDAEESHEALPMYYSLYHWKNLVNGYSGYGPPAYRIVREAMEEFPSSAGFRLLRDLGVGYILVHTRGYRADLGNQAARRLREFAGDAELIAQAEGDFLFRILPGEGRLETVSQLTVKGRPGLWQASTNRNPQLAARAFDGYPATGWTTGYPQFPGDFFQLDLAEELELERLEMDLEDDALDFPRGFVLEGSLDGRSWQKLAGRRTYWPEIKAATAEDFSSYRVVVAFPRCRVRFLRLQLTRNHPRHWTIREIRALG